MTHSLILAGAKLGLRVLVATPPEYGCLPSYVAMARDAAKVSGGSLSLVDDPHAAVVEADIVYTDVWTSMGQEAERERRRRAFGSFQINEHLMAHAPASASVMHCLPAHRGEEIVDSVIDGAQSIVFDQAENRLHAQKAILVWLLGEGQG